MSEAATGSVIPSSTPPPVSVTPSPGSVNPTVATPPPSTTDWTAGMADEARGYIANKGFKSPADVLESYRNFEKLQGVPQDRILKLPENLDSPEARALWERLGAPKEAKDYKFEGVDPKHAEYLAKVYHELGVPKSMAEKVTAKLNEYSTQQATQAQEAQKQVMEQAKQTLMKEWGAAFEQNTNVVDSAARNLGLDPKENLALANALGPDKAMKLLYKLGTATGEHTFVTGKNANTIMEPTQALSKISQLKTDSTFQQRLHSGEVGAVAEWQRAHEMAFPGETGL